MGLFSQILFVFALVMLVVSALAPAEPWRWRLLCFGLACLAGAFVVGGLSLAVVHSPGH